MLEQGDIFREFVERGQRAQKALDEILDDEPKAKARATDPETSHEAAASVKVRESQRDVLKVLREFGPLTDMGISRWSHKFGIRQSPSGLRTRRKELVNKGLVEWTGRWERLPSGRRARVWRVIE